MRRDGSCSAPRWTLPHTESREAHVSRPSPLHCLVLCVSAVLCGERASSSAYFVFVAFEKRFHVRPDTNAHFRGNDVPGGVEQSTLNLSVHTPKRAGTTKEPSAGEEEEEEKKQ